MSSKQDLEFAIIGGGIGGLSFGLALLQRNINVQVYEAAHQFGEIGAGVSFTPNAIQAMTMTFACSNQRFSMVPGQECVSKTLPS